ncbi:MAG: 3'-5' exonuclease [Caldisericia bacterium]|nr:3'-5' exonuclease [Caldisericia bacterium]
MKKYIIFDFETTGLYPPKASPVQLSYITLGEDLSFSTAKNFYFSVPFIPIEASRIHGLTVEKLAKLNAKSIEEFKNEIANDFSSEETTVIAHNYSFDRKFFQSYIGEIHFKSFCTMTYYTPIIKIPGKINSYKWPRLSESLEYLGISNSEVLKECNSIFSNQKIGFHDSRFDVTCIFKMIQLDHDLKKSIESSAKES